MLNKTIEKSEITIVDDLDSVGMPLGIVDVESKFEDDGNKRGVSISMSVGRIAASSIILETTRFLEDGMETSVSERLEGVEESSSASIYFDIQGRMKDWQGVGYSRYSSAFNEPAWSAFGLIRQNNRRLSDYEWLVGADRILNELKTKITVESDDTTQESAIYGATYIRFNKLIADSYRNLIKERKRNSVSLNEVLLFDPDMTSVVNAELESACKYADFTSSHVRINYETKQMIENSSVSNAEKVAATFDENRKKISLEHRDVIETCQSMLDSTYVPAGFRMGAGRTWPYMDINEYGMEINGLKAGNFGYVLRELDRETAELDYKQREFIQPGLLVLRALAGQEITLWG